VDRQARSTSSFCFPADPDGEELWAGPHNVRRVVAGASRRTLCGPGPSFVRRAGAVAIRRTKSGPIQNRARRMTKTASVQPAFLPSRG
jgi:hypothetical protein